MTMTTPRSWLSSLFIVLTFAVVAFSAHDAEARRGRHSGGGFEAPLVRCASVNRPGALSACGGDPLGAGSAEIEFARVDIKVAGAIANTIYTVVLRAPRSAQETTLGTLTTNAAGNGALQAPLFRQGDVASGIIVLRRAGADQFVAGILSVAQAVRDRGAQAENENKVENENEIEKQKEIEKQIEVENEIANGAEFETHLVRCSAVTTPASLTGCGTDPLQEGRADLGEAGGFEIEVIRAAASATYDVVLRPLQGADVSLGSLTTDADGNGSLERANVFAATDVTSSLLVLRRNGADQFVQGIRVHTLAAVLPASRSVQIGVVATAYATIINVGPSTATGCRIVLASNVPATFAYQTTDPITNKVTGTPNTPVDIPAGAAQSFVVALTPTGPFRPKDVDLSFECANTAAAVIATGLNTLLFSASTTPVPDVVSLAATLDNDGIVSVLGTQGTGVFAVAIANVGTTGHITASADTGGATLPVTVTICRTNSSGRCEGNPQPTVTTDMGGGGFMSFAIFVTANGSVPFDPANNRIFIRFRDETGDTRGSTSVAVRTL